MTKAKVYTLKLYVGKDALGTFMATKPVKVPEGPKGIVSSVALTGFHTTLLTGVKHVFGRLRHGEVVEAELTLRRV